MTKTIEQLESERAARKAELAAKRREQLAVDLAQLNDLEIQRGDDAVVRVDLERFFPGLPTMVIARVPEAVVHKRYKDQVATDGGIKAGELMAEVSILYPEKDVYTKLREALPGLHTRVAVAIAKAADGKAAEEEKK